jgi:MFS family permease
MCAVSGIKNIAAIAIGRFLCGLLSAVPTVVGSGSIEDIWAIRERIVAIDIWIKGSIVGIALGPSFATYVGTSTLGWYGFSVVSSD